MSKHIVITGAAAICISILLGALAAHGLKSVLSGEMLEIFDKGVRYQSICGFGLLILGFQSSSLKFRLNLFFIFKVVGIILFSFGLYGYSFHEQYSFLKPLVHVVPIGGFSMIIAWIILIIQIMRNH